MHLTRRAIDAMTYAGQGKQRDVRWDDEAPGLGLRIYPSGRKVFVLSYRTQGRKRLITLGPYGVLLPEEARRQALKLRARVLDGADPLGERRAERTAETVEQLAHDYIELHAKRHKRSWRKDASILERDVLPRIGKLKAKDVRRRDVIALLERVHQRSPIMSNRTLEVVRKMFNFGVQRDVLEYNPAQQIPKLAKEVRRDQWLAASGIRVFWRGLDQAKMTPEVRTILRLILVLAQRPGEVCGMTKAELDLEGGWWTIPAERSKNGLPHRVPLSRLALALLEPFLDREGALFTRALGKPIHVSALAHAIKRNRATLGVDDFRPHDLRRTAASHMTGMGISRLVVARILNHADAAVTAVYDRHSYDKEKRQALDAWAEQLDAILAGEVERKVVAIR
ncbi:MAG TPA: tyrosine-type recombinase/integrase [Burkholderiales bacterium]